MTPKASCGLDSHIIVLQVEAELEQNLMVGSTGVQHKQRVFCLSLGKSSTFLLLKKTLWSDLEIA